MPGCHDPLQHHRRLSPFSLNSIEEYFTQLNPIAKRIAYDINDTKAKYGHLWDTLEYHEQNDIINDTLIRPEISLRYFDHFLTPTPTNSSGNSYQSSTDSLTAIVLKNVGSSRHNTTNEEKTGKKISLKSYAEKFSSLGLRHFYSYDGRNLHTFGIQKVALKVIRDDTLGCFPDEHSRPFCYRTKSQINLLVLPAITKPMAAGKDIHSNTTIAANSIATFVQLQDCTHKDEDSKKALGNYHRLQNQLKINLKEKKSHDLQNPSLSYTSIKPSSISGNRKVHKSPDNSYKHETKDKASTSKKLVLQNYINSTQINVTPKIGNSFAVFSDSYNAAEESFNLLQHCGQSDINMGSCSSAATSDDEKTLEEEDVHLLENDSNIRKGFDFLNNW